MPIGAGTYNPHAKFAFPRSYIYQFNILVDTPVTQDGRFFTFPDGGTPTRLFHVTLFENVYNWSSNRYTLDFMIEESYYTDLVPPFTHDMPFTLVFDYGSFPGLPTLSFLPFGLPFTDPHLFPLPPAPPGYWLPNFP